MLIYILMAYFSLFISENAHLKTDKQELNEQRQHMELELQKARLSLEEASLSQVRHKFGVKFLINNEKATF